MKLNQEYDHMIMIPAIREDGYWDLLLVLSDGNIDRMKQYDPAEANLKHIKNCQPADIDMRKLQKVVVCYATHEEIENIMGVQNDNWYEAVEKIKRLFRGFKYRPEKGDGSPTVEIRSAFRPDN